MMFEILRLVKESLVGSQINAQRIETLLRSVGQTIFLVWIRGPIISVSAVSFKEFSLP